MPWTHGLLFWSKEYPQTKQNAATGSPGGKSEVYVPQNTLKELLWKLLEQHLTSRRCSLHRGKGFSFVAHPLQGKTVPSYVLNGSRNGYYNCVVELLCNCYITTVLCLATSALTLCYQLLCCCFRQTVPVKEAVLRLSPKLWVFPAELQNPIPPPTLTWPLALEI